MKGGILNIVKARFLVDEDAFKNWLFILFMVVLAIAMIANSHRFDQKIFKIADLTNEVKELRSEFVDCRSQLMKLKMESTVSSKMKDRGILPSKVPPQKIKVKKIEEKGFFKKLWQ
ncbi:FtsL-like putative cell division protein [Flavobacterium sp. SUN046]|jgi:hypothetical protein|uniref:FtsL-like putative cell division protein n=1 Tax=Flavobacterium sp. SUN046 TaxID=3002440 RepID=UPI002DBF1444|nr:FtsL-like putative cell division protein [Flavobacterium sp. SUN046]MEC4050421.1 FtsL-like putative cell division protein [Flavobacterium sp. SUN046]